MDESIVICGGGLAGLCLARQLVLSGHPPGTIRVLEKLVAPLPEGAKVGESMFEAGSHYLADVLQLREWLERQQVTKMGLRFFLGGGAEPFERRPEIGLCRFPDYFQTFQMERGSVENHLRERVKKAGVQLDEGVTVEDVTLSSGDEPHVVHYRDAADAARTLQTRWVVDATGRRKLLQKRLGLTKPSSGHSAAWLYARPWVSVEDFVPESNRPWHERVPDGNRVYSTTSLCGDGYWVWLIALPNNLMSIGIVVREEQHAFDQISTQGAATRWLEKHEPALAKALSARGVSGFRTLRNYSYTSSRIFSEHRWACVGEAALFTDPMLANGVDLIGIANLITGRLIELDRAGQLTPQSVDGSNRFALQFCDAVTPILQHVYPYLGHDLVAVTRLLWTFLNGWFLTGPVVFDRTLLASTILTDMIPATARVTALNQKMYQLFDAWAARSKRRNTFEFIDYFKLPFMKQTRRSHVEASKDRDDLLQKFRRAQEVMEELAQAIFLIAVEDVCPEQLETLMAKGALHTNAMSLEPSRWEHDGLFRRLTRPPANTGIHQSLRALFAL